MNPRDDQVDARHKADVTGEEPRFAHPLDAVPDESWQAPTEPVTERD